VRQFASIEAPLADGTSDHQGSHLQEPRPHAPGRMDNCPHLGSYAAEQVLIENEERLNRQNLAIPALDSKISVVESLLDVSSTSS
jgi:hypothetical protein